MTQNARKILASAVLSAAALVILISTPGHLVAQQAREPEIHITEVPPAAGGGPNEMFPIAGAVAGVPVRDYRVVIYCYAGSQWWVQPFDYAPLTEIRSTGRFETETHGGSIYAALLVRASYRAAPTLVALPDVGGDVVAKHRVAGKKD